MDDFSVPVSIPLDSDGFLRRECYLRGGVQVVQSR